MRLWSWWLSTSSRETDPLPLALVRIGIAVVIAGDLLRGAWLGLVPWLWRPFSHGGLSTFQSPYAIIDNIAPLSGGPALVVVTIVAMAFVAAGVLTRPAMLVGLLAYSQLGHLYPPGDRAVDRLMRTGLLILLFSGSHLRLSLQRRLQGKPPVTAIPAWPADMMVFILVLVYLSAGIHKLGSSMSWVSFSGRPMLHRILTNPLAARVPRDLADQGMGLLHFLGFSTVALECSAVLLLTRLRPWWALGGVGLHLGIAATMNLGAFSFGMLAFYPLLFSAWLAGRQYKKT